MLSVKTLIWALTTSLCLLLTMPLPGMAGESPFESLPVGAKARLGRGWVTDAQYSPDGTRLAVGSSVGIWLYDTQTYETTSLLTGHTYGVVSVAFSPDDRTLASAGRDDTIRLWDPDTGTLRYTLEDPLRFISDHATSLAFSPDGRILASAARTNTVHLWDVAGGTFRRTLKVKDSSSLITSLAFSPDGRTLAIGIEGTEGTEGAVQLWAVNTDTLLHTLRGCMEKRQGAGKGGSGVGFTCLTSGLAPAPPVIPYIAPSWNANPTTATCPMPSGSASAPCCPPPARAGVPSQCPAAKS